MIKVFTLGFLACAFVLTNLAAESGVASSKKMRIGVDVNYTRVAMKQVNKQLDRGGDVTNFGPGISGMLDLDLFLTRFLFVGARAGYLYCLPAEAEYNYVVYNQTTTIHASLIPLEGGLSANIELPSVPISLMAGVYGGYGFAFASFKNKINALGQTETFIQPFNGGGFVGELLAKINLKLSSAVSLNVNGGYRLAKIARMVQSEDVDFDGIPGLSIHVGEKGDILKDSDNDDLAFDFSGFNIGAGLSLGF